MGWSIGESSDPQERHNAGQEAGSKADGLEQFGHYLFNGIFSDEYNEGYENGVRNQSKDD